MARPLKKDIFCGFVDIKRVTVRLERAEQREGGVQVHKEVGEDKLNLETKVRPILYISHSNLNKE